MSSLHPGDVFAGLTVIKLLGEGGMGEVYLVENPALGRREALKVIRASDRGDQLLHRFRNEAKVVAALDHPSIITIYSYGVENGAPWFTMQYHAGVDLVARGPQPPVVVTRILSAAASALDYAHGHDVIHRDVKPANISTVVAPDGIVSRVTVLDFGIARLLGHTRMTMGNAVMGSIGYTAPEAFVSGESVPQSDQYSLACTAFEFLTGHRPVDGDTVVEIVRNRIDGAIPVPSMHDPRLRPYDDVFARALAKDQTDRFPTCGAFAAAFAAVVASHVGDDGARPPAEQSTEVLTRRTADPAVAPADPRFHATVARTAGPRTPRRRHWTTVLVAAAAALLLAAAGAGAVAVYDESQNAVYNAGSTDTAAAETSNTDLTYAWPDTDSATTTTTEQTTTTTEQATDDGLTRGRSSEYRLDGYGFAFQTSSGGVACFIDIKPVCYLDRPGDFDWNSIGLCSDSTTPNVITVRKGHVCASEREPVTSGEAPEPEFEEGDDVDSGRWHPSPKVLERGHIFGMFTASPSNPDAETFWLCHVDQNGAVNCADDDGAEGEFTIYDGRATGS